MAPEWWVWHGEQAQGPMTPDELAECFARERLPSDTLVSAPHVAWTCAWSVEAWRMATAHRERLRRRDQGELVLAFPEPPPGEPWFHPVTPWKADLCDILSFGTYELACRYRQRWWATRRAQRLVPSVGALYAGAFDLELDVALAADRVGVPREFAYGTGSGAESFRFAIWLMFCPPFLTMLDFHGLGAVRRAIHRVNETVAPGVRGPRAGLPEVLAFLFGLFVWGLVACGFTLEVLDEVDRRANAPAVEATGEVHDAPSSGPSSEPSR
jgi:hypothetical protein